MSGVNGGRGGKDNWFDGGKLGGGIGEGGGGFKLGGATRVKPPTARAFGAFDFSVPTQLHSITGVNFGLCYIQTI